MMSSDQEKRMCASMCICVFRMRSVCVHIFASEDTSPDWVGGHFMLAGRGVQEAWRTMNSSVCSYKHNCLHLLWARGLPSPVLNPHPSPITYNPPTTPISQSRGQMVITVLLFPFKPIKLLQDTDRTWLQTTRLIHRTWNSDSLYGHR